MTQLYNKLIKTVHDLIEENVPPAFVIDTIAVTGGVVSDISNRTIEPINIQVTFKNLKEERLIK